MPNLQSTNTLAGVPVHYDRHRPGDYGKPGHPFALRLAERTMTPLEECFGEIVTAAPDALGSAKYILSAGGYVQKPGYHGLGRAFDLDGIIWENHAWVAASFPDDPPFYLAIEAVIRRKFGTVLNYDYNAAHQDHIHLDDSTGVGFSRMSKSRVIFLQNAISFVYGNPIGRDGVWGPETNGAERTVREELGLSGFSDVDNWLSFLETTTQRAFEEAANREAARMFAHEMNRSISIPAIWKRFSDALAKYDKRLAGIGKYDVISKKLTVADPASTLIKAIREYSEFMKHGIDPQSDDFGTDFRTRIRQGFISATAFYDVVDILRDIYQQRGWRVTNA